MISFLCYTSIQLSEHTPYSYTVNQPVIIYQPKGEYYHMKHKWNQFLAGALCICFLTGCRGNLSISSDSKEIRGYSAPQTMIVVATERNRYEEVYTDDLWNVTLNDGTLFQDYLLDQIEMFLQNMKAMTYWQKNRAWN